MNDSKLLQYLQESLRDKNKTIKELTEYMVALTSTNKKYKYIIKILTFILILSIVGHVFLLYIKFMY